MIVRVLCSDESHPVNRWLESWQEQQRATHDVRLLRRASDLDGGDFLFLVSCHEIIRAPARSRFRHTLVLHASDLPEGRGMSPHVWQILEGRHQLVVTLLAAADGIDSGDVWKKEIVFLEGHELCDEIHAALFTVEVRLMSWALENCDVARPVPQPEGGSTYRKRTPADSRLDPGKSLAEQFDLLRIADPARYPAFVELRGFRYKVTLEKVGPVTTVGERPARQST